MLQRPELRPLIGGTELAVDAGLTGLLSVPTPGWLVVAPRALADGLSAVRLRLGLELAWLSTVAPDRPALTGLLAARVAALYLAIEPPEVRAAAADDRALEWLGALDGALPARERLRAAWRKLCALMGRPISALAERDIAELAELWSIAGPAEQIMTTGGDERLRVDPATGLNKYGCSPRPRPWAVTFASSTASSISERGYGAAEACRRRLLRAALEGRLAAGLAEEAQAARAGILRHWGVGDLADCILAASGTDATLLSSALTYLENPARPLTAVVTNPGETGSGVPRAVIGRHFSGRTALGHPVTEGAEVWGLSERLHMATVPLRNAAGRVRGAEGLETEIAQVVAEAADRGTAVLHVVDGSKTGLVAPRTRFVDRLVRTHTDRLAVVVDACQARLGTTRMRHYLERGWMVLVTGSKFYTGPPFSGALLVPRTRLARLGSKLPQGLGGYSSAADWPSPAPAGLAPEANPGLILRWSAALAEMRGFNTVPIDRRTEILSRFGREFQALTAGDPHLVPFPSPAPTGSSGDRWDQQQTIFPFGVRDPASGALMDVPALAALYRWLNADLSPLAPGELAARPCHIGQPVPLGQRAGRQFGALRIAAGARLVSGEPSHARLEDEARLERELSDLGSVIEKIRFMLDRLPELQQLTIEAGSWPGW